MQSNGYVTQMKPIKNKSVILNIRIYSKNVKMLDISYQKVHFNKLIYSKYLEGSKWLSYINKSPKFMHLCIYTSIY